MWGKALKSEIAFQEDDAREIYTGHIARGLIFNDSETGGDAGAVCPAARTRLHLVPTKVGGASALVKFVVPCKIGLFTTS